MVFGQLEEGKEEEEEDDDECIRLITTSIHENVERWHEAAMPINILEHLWISWLLYWSFWLWVGWLRGPGEVEFEFETEWQRNETGMNRNRCT
jgi:hypothetical protein